MMVVRHHSEELLQVVERVVEGLRLLIDQLHLLPDPEPLAISKKMVNHHHTC